MKARIALVEGMTFVAESGSGHAVVVDASPDVGGRNLGARPMELVLMGTGACSAIDVVHILRKARQPIAGCVVELEAERAPEDPKVFTRVHFHYVVTGSDSPLFAKPLGGGAERQVLDCVREAAFVVMPDGIYYIGRGGDDRQYALQFFQFSTGTSRLLTKIQGTPGIGLTVSPDRKTFLFATSVTSGSDLMLIENFR